MNECHSWVYEPHWSKIGPPKEIVGECKYKDFEDSYKSNSVKIIQLRRITRETTRAVEAIEY